MRFMLTAGIYLLWFAAVFDPVGNMYQLRYISLGYAIISILLLIAFGVPSDNRKMLTRLLILCMSVLMPVYGIFLYSLRGGSTDFVDTSYIAAGILLVTTVIYKDEDLCQRGIAALVFSLRLLAIVIIIIYLAFFFEFNRDWVSFFTESNVAIIATREYGGVILPYINFLASPMLIYLIGHEIHQFAKTRSTFRLLMCFMSMLAFALSGTRAHMILAIFYGPLYYLLISRNSKLIGVITTVAIAMALLLFISPDFLGELFSTKETSNQLKLELISMYTDAFSNPISLFFGQGYNAHEWYVPLREKLTGIENASKTELTYFELIRVYGIVLSGFFFCLLGALAYRAAKLRPKYRWFYPAFVIYMGNAALNPYLFSTNGMLPLALLTALVSLRQRPMPLHVQPARPNIGLQPA